MTRLSGAHLYLGEWLGRCQSLFAREVEREKRREEKRREEKRGGKGRKK
jgi:hypothetical protein